MSAQAYFTADTFAFLADLTENNDRDWFNENKGRYEAHVKEPSLRFVSDFAPHLKSLSPHFSAGPRSLFRIHRDVRFSKDKSPYKTYAGIQFRHDVGKDVHAPGYYLHIEPGQAFAALGIWHPNASSLGKIRERIVEEPDAWEEAAGDPGFARTFEPEGEQLKRAPRGFDPEHRHIEDLKRKDFIAVRRVPEETLTGPDFPGALAETFAAGRPYMQFLCGAVGVPF